MKEEKTFIEWFLEKAIPENKNRIYIEGDGGFGKTKSLKYLCKVLINSYEQYRIIPIYLDAKLLTTRTIPQYIIREYCGDCTEDYISIENILIQQLNNSNYKYLLIIDGLNEVDSSVVNKKIIEFLYDELIDNQNIYIVLSSRTPLTEYKELDMLCDFLSIRFKELNKEKVKKIVKKKISNPSDLMLSVFTNPMMLSIYINTHNKEKYKNIENQSQVLDIFFEEQWLLSTNWRKEETYEKNYDKFVKFIILEYLPNLCRFGENLFQIEDIEYNLTKTDYKNSAFGYVFKQNRFDEIRNLKEKHIEIREYLRDELRIINYSVDSFTIHEKYSSYFQAKYFDLALDAWLKDSSKTPEFLLVKTYDIEFEHDYDEHIITFVNNHFKYFNNVLRCCESIQLIEILSEFKRVIYYSIDYFLNRSLNFSMSKNKKIDFAELQNDIIDKYVNIYNTQYHKYVYIIKKYIDSIFSDTEEYDFLKDLKKCFESILPDTKVPDFLEEMRKYFGDVLRDIEVIELSEILKKYFKNAYEDIVISKLSEALKEMLYVHKEKFSLEKEKSNRSIQIYFLELTKRNVNLFRNMMDSMIKLYLGFPFRNGYQLIEFFLNQESIEFIYQISLPNILRLLNYLRDKNNQPPSENSFVEDKFEWLYSLYINLIKNIVLYNHRKLSEIDFSNLELSSLNLSGISLYNNSLSQIDFRNSDIKKSDLFSIGYYSVPCVHSDEIKLLWYTDLFFAVNYPYRKETVFIFDTMSSILTDTTGNYRFVLETNRSSYDNYNFLYIPKGTRDLYSYNFLLKSGAKLFTLNDDVEIKDINMLSWMNCCNYILMVYKNEKIYFDLDGNIIERRSYKNEKLVSDSKKNNLYEPYLEDKCTSLIKEKIENGFVLKIHWNSLEFSDKEFILEKIGNNKFNMNQFQFNKTKQSVLVGCQKGKTVCLKEWTSSGQYIRTIDFIGTVVDKCFIRITSKGNCFNLYGFDQNYYYIDDNGFTSKLKLLDFPFIGVTQDGKYFVFKLENGLKFCEVQEGNLNEYFTISFNEVLSKCSLEECCKFASAFVIGNAAVLSFENCLDNGDTIFYFVRITISDKNVLVFDKYEVKDGKKRRVVLNGYTDNLNIISYNIFNILAENFCEYDNFDFFDIDNYNFFVMKNDLIISSSMLGKTIIFDMAIMKIKEVLDNTIVYKVFNGILVINNDINDFCETRLKNIFCDLRTHKINSFMNFRNLKNVCFSKIQFTANEIEQLKSFGAILE